MQYQKEEPLSDNLRQGIITKLDNIIQDSRPWITINLEKGIYNYSIKYAKNKNIVRKWTNPVFRRIYLNKARSVYANLKEDSYLQNYRLLTRLKESEFL